MYQIMLVEDEMLVRESMAQNTDWGKFGFAAPHVFENGQQALEQLEALKPDVVITDICMPFMDGIEMIQKASEKVKFKSILLTSYAEFDYARRAIEARVCEYLLKPVDEEKLAKIMKKLGEEITSVRQVEYAMEQAELEGGNLNLEYYMKLDRSENGYVSKLVETIKIRYGEKLSIESISEEMGVSASYLSRKFKEITGQTFLDFLNKYRVQQAITLSSTRGRIRPT